MERHPYFWRRVTKAVRGLSFSLIGRVQKPEAKSNVERNREEMGPCPEASRSMASTVKGKGLSCTSNFWLRSR